MKEFENCHICHQTTHQLITQESAMQWLVPPNTSMVFVEYLSFCIVLVFTHLFVSLHSHKKNSILGRLSFRYSLSNPCSLDKSMFLCFVNNIFFYTPLTCKPSIVSITVILFVPNMLLWSTFFHPHLQ